MEVSTLHSSHIALAEWVPGTYWIGVWVDHQSFLDILEKKNFLPLLGIESWFLGWLFCILVIVLTEGWLWNVDWKTTVYGTSAA
jgi:hypothetical protein